MRRRGPRTVLRDGGPGDVDAIAGVTNRAYRVEESFCTGDRTDRGQVEALLRDGRFLVLERGGRLVGSVHVEARGPRGRFGMLSVEPALQGRGLGRRLVAAAEEACREAGCRDVEIQVVDLRAELFPFYRSLGYVESGSAPVPEWPGLRRPCRFVRMARALR